MEPRVHILGIPIDAITMDQALVRLHDMLRSGGQNHVMTPNSEMLVEARRDEFFRKVLCGAALNLPDSAGVKWAGKLPERVAGVDIIERLCGELGSECPVFLLGAKEGVAEKAEDALKKKNPQINIVGTYAGTPRAEDAEEIVKRIERAQPHLLLVAYGAPKQDLWIAEHLTEVPSVRVAVGVGGTLDFLAGTAKRAPKWMRSVGLEWLWRLLLEPWRLKRIWTAVVTFPFLVLINRSAGSATCAEPRE